MDFILLNLLNGISFGSILFLLAAGLSIILGFMNVLNLTHGALYMVGAYVGWTIAVSYELSFALAVIVGGIVAGLIGLIIDKGFLQHLHMKTNEQVLLTLGFTYILVNLSTWIWGAVPLAPFTAPALSGSISIYGITYPLARFMIIFIGIALSILLWWLQEKTLIGAIVRAGVDNKEMAMGLGINVKKVSSIVFFISTFIAGSAGVLGAQIFGVKPGFGFEILLLALVVIVVGGLGSVQGALLGGLFIGLVDAFGKALFPEFAMFSIYLAMFIILIIKPQGLVGRRMLN